MRPMNYRGFLDKEVFQETTIGIPNPATRAFGQFKNGNNHSSGTTEKKPKWAYLGKPNRSTFRVPFDV
jgi:hypothetical protein